MIFGFKNDAGQDVTLVDDVTVRDGTGWEVFVVTTGGQEDFTIFDQFASTFDSPTTRRRRPSGC